MEDLRWMVCMTLLLLWCPQLAISQVVTKPNSLSAPVITSQPQDLLLRESQPAQMECRASGNPEPNISWFKDGQPLDTSSSSFYFLVRDTLYFLDASDSAGVYKCRASNSQGTVYSRNATLSIAFFKSEFRQSPQNGVAPIGGAWVFACDPPKANPPAVVGWQKDGNPISLDGGRLEIVADGNLMISEVKQSDMGSYICTASSNGKTKSSAVANLTVIATPSFTSTPEDTIASPGETVIFRCAATGDPLPSISWSKVDGDLPLQSRILEDGSLRITSIVEGDAGAYECTASNEHDTNHATAQLKISDVEVFERIPRDQTVRVGQDISFHCQLSGNPADNIYWQNEDLELLLFESQRSDRFEVMSDGTLRISDVQLEDAGTYYCQANTGGETSRASAVLRVIGDSISPPPVILQGPHNQTLVVGSPASFNCELAPPLDGARYSSQWTIDDSPLDISLSRFSIDTSGTLFISSVQERDSGIYSCIVTNGSGETSWSSGLRVLQAGDVSSSSPVIQAPSPSQLPGAPRLLEVTNTTRSSALLSWQKPIDSADGQATNRFQIEYYSPLDTGWVIVPTVVSGTTFRVTGLQPSTPYIFLVRGVNTLGIGPPSPSTPPHMTTEDGDIGLDLDQIDIEITHAPALSPNAILLNWEINGPDYIISHIEGFNVKCRPSSGKGTVIIIPFLVNQPKVATGLKPDIDYTISVHAFRGQQKSPESPLVGVRTLQEGSLAQMPPSDHFILQKLETSNPVVVSARPVESSKLDVSWRVDRHASYINGYHVKYFPVGHDNEPKYITVTETRSITLTGLDAWRQYVISVQPFNGLYHGAVSEEFVGKTGEDVPRDSPKNIHVSVNSSTVLIINWTSPPPDSIKGVLRGYNITLISNATKPKTIIVPNNTTLAKRVSGLMPATSYKVMVAAYTNVGVGPKSPASTVVMPAAGLVPGTGGDDDPSLAPWLILIFVIIIFMIIIIGLIILQRKRHEKSVALNKTPLHYEPTTERIIGMGSLPHNSGQNGTQQPLPPLPTEDGKSSFHGNTPLMTTFSTANGTLKTSTLDRYKPCPHNTHQPVGPAYWLLEHHDPEYSCQGIHNQGGTLSSAGSSSSHRAKSPVYAVVDGDDFCQDQHSPHTMPMHNPYNPNHAMSSSSTLQYRPTQPYASTQLCLPQTMRVGSMCSCSGSSNDTGCSSGSSHNTQNRQSSKKKKVPTATLR